MLDSTEFLDSIGSATYDFRDPDETQVPILIVDDDPTMRDALRTVLIRAGYKVLTASNGQEAWMLLGRSLPRIAVLVSDVEMPQMSGVELAKLATIACTKLPILLISGNPLPSEVQPLSCEFLQKPFRLATFLKSVRDIVNQSKLQAVQNTTAPAGST